MGAAASEQSPQGQHIVSREAELRVLQRFLESSGAETCLVLSGDAGIGKTTLWEAGLETAGAHDYLVLSTRANQSEVELSFVALADLIEGVEPDVLASLPAPQLNALEVALRRREPSGDAPDPFAISAALLSTLRALAEHRFILVAIDDVHWLDRPSAAALLYVVRRLPSDRVRLLITRRSGRRSDLERALKPADVTHLNLAALSLGATGVMLSDHLGLRLTRRVLRQLHDASQGNPLFSLELGRVLMAAGIPDVGSELPIPDVVDDIFDTRVRELPDPLRRALLAVVLSPGMSPSELLALVDPTAAEDARTNGLLVFDRSRVRAAHPMLAAAARRQSSAQERRELHLQLSSALVDPTLRARHLGMGTNAPDQDVATLIAAAAGLAAKRGAAQDAEELGAHALRLTPPHAPELAERILALGRYHARADNMPRVTALLTERMHDLPSGRARAMAHILLGEAADVAGNWAHADLALAEGGGDPEVRALALAKKARLLTNCEVERIDEAEAWALEAVSVAQPVGAQVLDRARTALAWARFLRGDPIDDLGPSDPAAGPNWNQPESSIDPLLAIRLMCRGKTDEARASIARLLALADERGDLQTTRMMHQLLCELELRTGNVREAARSLDELVDAPQWLDNLRAGLHAILAAVTGDPVDATRWAANILDTSSAAVQGRDRLDATWALGLAALFEHDANGAIERLGSIWEHTQREHVGEPGAFPVAADLVEAMADAGRLDEARDVTDRLRSAAVAQQHPWGMVTATRCSAAIDLSTRYGDDAATALLEAAADYGQLGLHFDRGRCLLLLGRFQRRFNKRAAARGSLEEAADQFERVGCSGWAENARSELLRVSGRRSADNDLTPSERRVVELAVRGLSNKEIAAHLFVSVYTVEAHLSHVYTKLGIRSRAQLASRTG